MGLSHVIDVCRRDIGPSARLDVAVFRTRRETNPESHDSFDRCRRCL
jgi:hypothetical protein